MTTFNQRRPRLPGRRASLRAPSSAAWRYGGHCLLVGVALVDVWPAVDQRVRPSGPLVDHHGEVDEKAVQRSGAGSALLAEFRRRALAHGARGIVLHTAHFLPAAIRLYERHGFERNPAHDLRAADVIHLPDPSLDFPALAYRLDLQ